MEHDGSNEDPIPILQNNFQVDEMTEENKAMEYDSDTSNDSDGLEMDCEEDEGWGDEEEQSSTDEGDDSGAEDQPQRKRQRLNTPVLTARRNACENKHKILKGALKDIEKHI